MQFTACTSMEVDDTDGAAHHADTFVRGLASPVVE